MVIWIEYVPIISFGFEILQFWIMAEFDKPFRNFVAPSPKAFGVPVEKHFEEGNQSPQAYKVEKSRINQTRGDTKTLIWGERDALPLMILDAINKSPTASACLGKVEKFIRGSGFVDKGLEDMVIDENGTTLLQHHQYLSAYIARLEGFSTNFKYNEKAQITNAYGISMESCRIYKPEEDSTDVSCIKFNPYFGSVEYKISQTDDYPMFDLSNIQAEIELYQDKYKGQIYFYGAPRPPYKFYPVPKYWSAEHWIHVDGQIQTFHKENLSNGFFQSALLNVIGDPDEPSRDPKDQTEYLDTDGVTKLQRSTRTEGERFNAQMAQTFSGVKKAGSVLVSWSLNQDQFAKLSAFPVNSNFDVMSGTYTDAIKGICIATEVDPIFLLAVGNGLANAGDSKKASIEIMQANAADPQSILENYYNNILIPNHINGSKKAKVKIKPYSPISTSVTVDKQYWEFMNESEKIQFITDNVPQIKINRTPIAEANTAPATLDENGNVVPAPNAPTVDENLKNMKVSEVKRIKSFMKQYEKGELTFDQAKQLLAGFGLNEEQQAAWLQI